MTQKINKQVSPERYIGLMCGTSIDGVDVALAEFSNGNCQLIDSYLHPVDKAIKSKLNKICQLNHASQVGQPVEHRIELLGEMDTRMGQIFAEAVNQFIALKKIDPTSITAIGSHGQTIRHQPATAFPFSMQIGDPSIIALKTGITTVADFRRMDIAAGGQGAPLAPAFHNAVLRSAAENRIILNLGGIANITLLPKSPNQPVLGFDTGTANTLLDSWYCLNHPSAVDDFDRNSLFAQQGQINQSLLALLCDDPYFNLPPPKSTGREYFSIEWLTQKINETNSLISAADVQRTLLEFTAVTIRDAIFKLALDDFNIYTCGGGTHNPFLIERLMALCNRKVQATDTIGVSGDYLEALTFAWLARQRLHQLPGNLPSVTGARESKILGAVYLP